MSGTNASPTNLESKKILLMRARISIFQKCSRRFWKIVGAIFFSFAFVICAANSNGSDVVINELMYHSPGEQPELQFVELFNHGPHTIDLSHWAFTKGIKFTFPANTKLLADAYIVVCRDLNRFNAHYGTNIAALGNFSGKLSHHRERVELTDAQHTVIDSIEYSTDGDWPRGPTGHGSSLERLTPNGPSQRPENWAASKPPATKIAGGTPGARNSTFSETLPSLVADVTFVPKAPKPNQSVKVIATVTDSNSVKAVSVLWRSAAANKLSDEDSLPMRRVTGDEHGGIYEAVIPAQPAATLVRFRIRAISGADATRLQPGENEPHPSFSYFSFGATNNALVPFCFLMTTGPRESAAPTRGRTLPAEQIASSGNGTFVYVPANSSAPQVFDHVRITPRHGGTKVHFWEDQPFKQMTGVNIIFEGPPRWVLSEPLSYELYRLAGVPAEQTEHVRLWKDGRMLGYHLLLEQPNKTFVARNGRDDAGNLYKLLWYGHGIVGQHEKKTHVKSGHEDLIKLINDLNKLSGEEQWKFIQQNFNVDEVINYFVVNMCIQNWDGFFNNYYAYHDTGKTGKWEIYPWDEDKTWGDYDGASAKYDWYEMPLTFGMKGDRAPAGDLKSRFFGRGFQGPWGGPGWWRPPGYFSGPLLANAEFRKRFLTRLDDVCSNIFTEQKMLPLIDGMEKRLGSEVRIRAEAIGEDASSAVENFRIEIQSLRDQVRNRRKFIQAELKKQN